MRRWAFLALLLVAPATSFGQGPSPDSRGEVALREPAYRGVRANAPIPPEMHIRNEGGSDGAGLCVLASGVISGRYQRVEGLAGGKDSLFWRAGKRRPGGYGPDKLARHIAETLPGVKWTSIQNATQDQVDKLSALGYPVNVTMSTGQQYQYKRIYHDVTNVYSDKRTGLACFVDNNDPGKYHWIPWQEASRRLVDGWIWIWNKRPPAVSRAVGPRAFFLACCLAAAVAVLAFPRPQPIGTPSP